MAKKANAGVSDDEAEYSEGHSDGGAPTIAPEDSVASEEEDSDDAAGGGARTTTPTTGGKNKSVGPQGLQFYRFVTQPDVLDAEIVEKCGSVATQTLTKPARAVSVPHYVKGMNELFKNRPSPEIVNKLFDITNALSQKAALTRASSKDCQELVWMISRQPAPLDRRAAFIIDVLWDVVPKDARAALVKHSLEVSPYVANAVIPRLLSKNVELAHVPAIADLLALALKEARFSPLELLENHGHNLKDSVFQELLKVLSAVLIPDESEGNPPNTASVEGAPTNESRPHTTQSTLCGTASPPGQGTMVGTAIPPPQGTHVAAIQPVQGMLHGIAIYPAQTQAPPQVEVSSGAPTGLPPPITHDPGVIPAGLLPRSTDVSTKPQVRPMPPLQLPMATPQKLPDNSSSFNAIGRRPQANKRASANGEESSSGSGLKHRRVETEAGTQQRQATTPTRNAPRQTASTANREQRPEITQSVVEEDRYRREAGGTEERRVTTTVGSHARRVVPQPGIGSTQPGVGSSRPGVGNRRLGRLDRHVQPTTVREVPSVVFGGFHCKNSNVYIYMGDRPPVVHPSDLSVTHQDPSEDEEEVIE